ncbi:gamma-glutamylcyclotransferase family protein [Chachezhania antarctica]|uniref:gamma-glutamylcyclotransferase family protein n=1 Tax=Chachezhania antarctica TaxID=2340860 RepID=UPI000EAC32A1|nr:gamma-glutamylcyclotransferase family protein [Chachezhania antarctica]
MNDPYFFGYGSLVNRDTHTYPGAKKARLAGWRRGWVHVDPWPVAVLTAVAAPGSEIDGLIARVPGSDWVALDERERNYERLPATENVTHALAGPLDIAVYAVHPDLHGAPQSPAPILLSYLDVVVQGYLREFGPEGARQFFETTDGWHTPVLNDRAAPRYPRHKVLTDDERAVVDRWLDEIEALVQPLGQA